MKKKDVDFNLSYESDGKMGTQEEKSNASDKKSQDEEVFFNTTQSSE